MYNKIWNYELKTGYPTYIELLDNLVAFAQNKGWTVQTWKNAQWGYNSSSGQYEFLSGTHYYIRFEKTGYTNQKLVYWLKTWGENSTDNQVQFEITLKKPTVTPDYSNTTSEDAHLQNSVNRHYYKNLCIYYNIATVYFLSGNDDKFLTMVVKLDENHFYSYNFGSIISFKGERTGEDTDGQWVGNARNIYAILGQYPNFDNPYEVLWYFGKKCGVSGYGEYGYTITASCYLGADIISLGNDGSHFNISCPNGVPPYEPYPIKPLVQPMVWVKKTDINRWCPVGYLPHLIVASQGFKNQDIITYENKKYLFFQDIKKTTMGYCYRIA